MLKFKHHLSLLTRSQNPQPQAPEYILLPGHLFFTRAVDVPEGMAMEGVDAFAELALEEASPFPLEQLAWGWVLDSRGKRIFLHAVCKSRVGGPGLAAWAHARHVLPAFFPVLFHRAQDREAVLFVHGDAMSAMAFEPGVLFPVKILHRQLADIGEQSPEAYAGVQDELCRLMQQAGYPCKPGLRLFDRTHAVGNNRVRFICRDMSSGPDADNPPAVHAEEVAGDTLWRADLRDADFIVREKKDRLTQARLWRVLCAWGAAAGLLLLLSLIYVLWGWALGSRQTQITRLEPAVISVQGNDMLLQRLRQFSGQPFMPFNVLGVLNEFRPASIYFRSCALNNENVVTVQGVAANVEEVNRYSERLRQSGRFASVDLGSVQTRAGDIQFTLNLIYVPVPDTADAAESLALNP